jgi:hypothetical protein
MTHATVALLIVVRQTVGIIVIVTPTSMLVAQALAIV